MGDPIRVLIAEDHPFFRDGLRRALEQDPSVDVVAACEDGPTALERIRAMSPAIAILDIGLPELDGCAIVRQARDERLPVEFIFLTINDDPEIFDQSLEWGVKGYLLKDCTAAEILRCVRAVAGGQHYASPVMTTHLVERTRRVERFTRGVPGLDQLTPQERVILRRIAAGKRSKEVAEELGIAPKTVDAHRTSICRKLDVHGNYALTRFAVQHRHDI
jgi:DNA-binding NarL/FixJ family response regulator